MITLQSNHLKTHLSEVLRKVEAGQEIAITRHGKIIACLSPWKSGDKHVQKAAVQTLLNYRKVPLPPGETIEEMRREGRR